MYKNDKNELTGQYIPNNTNKVVKPFNKGKKKEQKYILLFLITLYILLDNFIFKTIQIQLRQMNAKSIMAKDISNCFSKTI